MNSITIIGNLTRDPESGTVDTSLGARPVCNFTVAVNRYARGEQKADFFRVTCWGKDAENAAKYLARGRKVAVQGEVTARAFLGNDNQPRASLDVTARRIEYLSAARGNEEAGAGEARDGFTPIDDDELPF